MTSRAIRFVLIAAAVTLLSGPLFAQTPPTEYDATVETTVMGTVNEVLTNDAQDGLHLVLTMKAAGEDLHIYVAPVMFVAMQNFSFTVDDEITVLGSKVKFEGKNWILARDIFKGGKTLRLRNKNGVTLWPAAPALTSR